MDKPIKVALIGTHGVGKTGLAHALVAAFTARSIPTEPILEVARELIRIIPSIVINEETTLLSQARILEYQFQREIEAEKLKCDVIICDRAFDNYLYMKRKFGKQPQYEEMILKHLKEHPYTLIIKVPIISKGLTDDNLRSLDPEFQKEIDKMIDEFLEEHKIPYVTLPAPVMPYREDWTYTVINMLRPSLKRIF